MILYIETSKTPPKPIRTKKTNILNLQDTKYHTFIRRISIHSTTKHLKFFEKMISEKIILFIIASKILRNKF